jgi:pyridoxine kinase
MAKGMAGLCAKADLVVPNLTEAAFILDEEYMEGPYTVEYIEGMLKKLSAMGPKQIVLTGVWFEEGKLGAACYSKATGAVGYAFARRVEGYFHGTGDVFGSTLLAGLLSGFSLEEATRLAVDYTYECIVKTVEAQQEIRYGVCFERALPMLMERLGLLKG